MGSCLSQPSKVHRFLRFQGQKIVLQEKVSEGAYGEIWKCKNATDEILAAKLIRFQSKEQAQMFKTEAGWLNKLKQVEGVVKIIGQLIVPHQEYKVGYIFMQFCDSSLVNQLKTKHFTAQQILQTILQLTLILQQIHEKGCLHLDIKPDNILFHGNKWKICDFGSCIDGQVNLKTLAKKQFQYFSDHVEANSTLIYRSPELIQLQGTIGYKSDIWMLGCIGYLLHYRKHPFEGQGKLSIVTASPKYTQNGPVEECLKGMLQSNPQSRWNEKQIISYITSIKES